MVVNGLLNLAKCGQKPVSDYGASAFTVTILNVRPVFAAISTKTIDELQTLTVNASATDPDVTEGTQTLTYQLTAFPAGARIGTNCVFTWTPAQTQSPSTNLVTVVVADNGTPPLSATNSFTMIVKEVNVAPVLPVQTSVTVNELTLLTVTNTASEANIHSTLGYALVNPPSGASINANGVITWTTAQTQSPSTNLFTTIATNSNPYDLVNPSLSTTNSFTVIVREVNVAPVLPVQPAVTVNELTLLTVTNAASESNIHSTLSYALVNPPAGASIRPNGVITWTPSQTQSPSTNVFTTIAVNSNPYDLVNPNLSATNSFTVIVKEKNVQPALPIIPTQTVNELTLLIVTNAATNANIHSSITGYNLATAPSGMVISASGIITWTPAQAQSPSTNLITTIVTNSNPYDLVNPQLTATNTFTVIVREVNVDPVLPVIAAKTIYALTALTVANTATEANIHATVTYGLVNSPTGLAISSGGMITWSPTVAQAPTTNIITTIATSTDLLDAVNPLLSTTNTFTVVVKPIVVLSSPTILPDGSFQLSINTVANTSYTVAYSTNLTDWTEVLGFVGDGTPVTLHDPNAGINPQGFYRVLLAP